MWSRLLALALVLLGLPVLSGHAHAGAAKTVASLAPSGLVLVMDADGNELVAQNADKPFVPASVAKIVTAWLAMEVLGGDYRFRTRFYLDDNRVLYVRGGGDPFLISEELALLAPQLIAASGKEPITGIVLRRGFTSPKPSCTAAYPSVAAVFTCVTTQGPASITVTGMFFPSSVK